MRKMQMSNVKSLIPTAQKCTAPLIETSFLKFLKLFISAVHKDGLSEISCRYVNTKCLPRFIMSRISE